MRPLRGTVIVSTLAQGAGMIAVSLVHSTPPVSLFVIRYETNHWSVDTDPDPSSKTAMHERPYEPADLPQVIEVYGSAIHMLAAPFYAPEQLAAWAPRNPDVERWRQRLAPVTTAVAAQDDVIVGFVSYALDGHLDLLFVRPGFARRGVATKLYHHVESALRAARVPRVFTEASLAARPFFEHVGFHVDAEELVEIRGIKLRRYAMHKQLPAE
jgi:putative acetyltransferase